MHRVSFTLLVFLVVAGCAAFRSTGSSEAPPNPEMPAAVDAGTSMPVTTKQQGNVNTAVQFIKQEAMPLSLAALLMFDKWCSHRREMTRIRANGVQHP